MCAKAQVPALKNDHEEAQKALKDAEDYGGNHEEFGYHLLAAGWQEIVSATRGLILKKKGDSTSARKIYQHTLSDYARARLALMSLQDGDENEARRLALQDETNPTAGLVLAQLEEKVKNIAAAKERYSKARARLQSPRYSAVTTSSCQFIFAKATR
jgi:tetratricopeptide (TPR) repeat protein